nr:ABC transporter ATP-binding protein [Microbacterium cremeum]
MTASLPVPNEIDPEEPDGHASPRVVPISPAPSPKPKKPRQPRKSKAKQPVSDPSAAQRGEASETSPASSADPGPPPPIPSDLEVVASVAADIVVPPKPPLPRTEPAAAEPVAEPEAPASEAPAAEPEAPVAEPEARVAEPEAPASEASVAEPEALVTVFPVAEPETPVAAPESPRAAAPRAVRVPVPAPSPGTGGDALVLRGVTKRFGSTHAVEGIDLTVPAGTFYGLVGPNGAGKTTTLSMIAGLLDPDRGTIRVGGVDTAATPRAAKKLMGVLPDRLRTFDRLTGRQLLYYYGVLRGLPPAVVESRTADLARAFDLEEALGRSVSDYSAGMLKKVMLAGALIHSPRLLVLDEPFEAVDPVSSAVILDILSTYVAHGGTVILSSHGMELVERVCSRVAVIVAGQVLAEGTVDEVRGELTLEQRFVELAGGLSDVEGLEWLHTFSD